MNLTLAETTLRRVKHFCDAERSETAEGCVVQSATLLQILDKGVERIGEMVILSCPKDVLSDAIRRAD